MTTRLSLPFRSRSQPDAAGAFDPIRLQASTDIMSDRYIDITIAQDGESATIEAFGFEGTSCTEATAAFEHASGGKVERVKIKPEMRTATKQAAEQLKRRV